MASTSLLMPQHLHIDFETFSEIDIRDVGAYRYANDPSTEILCAAMALGDGPPVIWHSGLSDEAVLAREAYWIALEDPNVLVYAHNAQFEMAIAQALMWKQWGIKCPDLRRFRCTASLARRAALPAKLETLAEVLGLSNQKDKRGKALIKKFSMLQSARKPSKKHPEGVPPRRIRPEDDPAAFAEFCEYCRSDVRAEQEVARRLTYFDCEPNTSNYTLDAIINARGVTVNLQALRHAQKLIDEETEIVSAKFRALTGFEVTQNARLLAWCAENGFPFENLQAETVDTFLEEQEGKIGEPGIVEEALRLKQSIAYASIKKVSAMLKCAGPADNRIRGLKVYHAATTGRDAGSLVQFQNMRRSTIKDSEGAYREICNGDSREMLEICRGPVLEVIASTIRHFVHDLDGPLLDADYSSAESRIACWLSGQEDALQEYRDGVDRYRIMASMIYRVPAEKVNKHPQRFVGKQAVLGCGYGMGPAKFRVTCKKMGGYDLPQGLEETAVKAFRLKHKRVVSYWYELERAAKRAILCKGEVVTANLLSFKCRDIEGMPFLLMRLPSGRKLAYPKPRISDDRITFFGNVKGTTWGDVSTWGGTFLENACQAVTADVLNTGSHNCENAGYPIMTLIHDQALAYRTNGQTAEEFVRLLTKLPPWAKGLPIEAEGALVPFYKKD